MDVEDAEGAKFNKHYDNFSPGGLVTPSAIKRLQQKGIKRIEIEHPEIIHEPYLSAGGIGGRAAASEDWIARMSHSRLEAVMQEGAARGWVSDTSGLGHPLPALVTGG